MIAVVFISRTNQHKIPDDAIMKSLITTILLLFSVGLGTILAQQNNVTLMDKSTMQIEGTSNVHDWTADVEEMNFDISFNSSAVTSNSISNPVEALSLTIPVGNIESGKGGMNRKMHGALKKNDHPAIYFDLISSKVIESNSNSSFQLDVTGTLTVAGVEKEISLPVEGIVQNDGSYNFTGSYKTNMKDFDVDPPSAMFGAVRSGEMVTISFDLFFEKG